MDSFSCSRCGHYNDRVSLATRKRSSFTNVCDHCFVDRQSGRVAHVQKTMMLLVHSLPYLALGVFIQVDACLSKPQLYEYPRATGAVAFALALALYAFNWRRRKPVK